MKKIVVIGGGIAGISAAIVSAHKGYSVNLYEKMPTIGGRLNIIKKKGYVFDTGPSFLTMTYTYRDLFNSVGENFDDYVSLKKLDPNFTVSFKTGEKIRAWNSVEKIKKELEKVGEKNLKNLDNFLKKSQRRFDATFEYVVNKNVNSVRDFAKIGDHTLLFDGSLTRSIRSELNTLFTSDFTKNMLSLESFYLGMSPYNAPAVFSMLNYTDIIYDGVWRIEGGMYNLALAYKKLAEKLGVKIFTSAPLTDVKITNKEISSITVGGKIITADAFIVTADMAHFHQRYLPDEYSGKFASKRIDKLNHTMGLFTLYLGVTKTFPNSDHHNYIIGSDFHTYLKDLFDGEALPENPYYYVTNASKFDQSLAPKGCSSIFILVPVPNLLKEINWEKKKKKFADVVLKDVEKNGFKDLRKNIEVMEICTPLDWQNTFNLYKGSALGLSHNIRQLGPFRPKNYHTKISNLFFAGASTTPGTGLPMVTISGRLAVERMEERMRWN